MPANAMRLRHGLAQPGAKKEKRNDGGALPGPEGVAQKILRPPAEVAQIKAEMKHRHPHHGQATQSVNGGVALGAGGRKLGHAQ